MSITKNYRVSLKLVVSKWGVFEKLAILKGRSELDEDLVSKINDALQSTFVPLPPVRTTVAIGDDAEQKVMNHLLQVSQANVDFAVSDTSSMLNHGDMMVVHQGKRVCIEVKCYSNPVPMKEVSKYKMSLSHTEYDCGVMIQTEPCGFTRECDIKTPIDFKIDNGKPSVYLTNVDLAILYPIIGMIIAYNAKSDSVDAQDLETKRAALVAIHEQVLSLRVIIEQQKKQIAKMEAAVEAIVKLSLE